MPLHTKQRSRPDDLNRRFVELSVSLSEVAGSLVASSWPRPTEIDVGLEKLGMDIAFLRSHALWRRTNVRVLGILEREWNEEIHSNFLAWLLDPNESHGCGDSLLREFLNLFPHAPKPPFCRIEVRREFCFSENSRIDILVKTERCWLGIENKVNHTEGSNQLQRYGCCLEKTGTLGRNRFLLYITRDGKKHPHGRGVSWERVADFISGLRPASHAQPIVEQLLQNIEENLGS